MSGSTIFKCIFCEEDYVGTRNSDRGVILSRKCSHAFHYSCTLKWRVECRKNSRRWLCPKCGVLFNESQFDILFAPKPEGNTERQVYLAPTRSPAIPIPSRVRLVNPGVEEDEEPMIMMTTTFHQNSVPRGDRFMKKRMLPGTEVESSDEVIEAKRGRMNP